MTNINIIDLITREVLSRLAGSGEISVSRTTRDDGTAFLQAERTGGFWGVNSDDPAVLAKAIVESIIPKPTHQSEIDIDLITPAEAARTVNAKPQQISNLLSKGTLTRHEDAQGRPLVSMSEVLEWRENCAEGRPPLNK